MKTNLKIRSAALLAGALISLGAMAQTPDSDVQVVTTTVKFNRAEASTPTGAADLYHSLNRAAARVCVDHYASAALQRDSYFECRDAALAKAVDQVDISALSALHQGDRSRKGTVTFGQG
ncbi:MAG TPA: UrcA family protein [Steroidobacteraceae bacterium]|nr:UrcA family protein [Steroidobacteraceae bacterium]